MEINSELLKTWEFHMKIRRPFPRRPSARLRTLRRRLALERVTEGYRGSQRVTEGHRGSQRVTEGHRGSQRVTEGYRGSQRVTEGYRGLKRVEGGKMSHTCIGSYRKRIELYHRHA
jgi:hypothetical protein